MPALIVPIETEQSPTVFILAHTRYRLSESIYIYKYCILWPQKPDLLMDKAALQ